MARLSNHHTINPMIKNIQKGSNECTAQEIERLKVGLDQYKKDLKDAELKNEIITLGLAQIINKYRSMAESCDRTSIKLLCSCIVRDIINTGKASEIDVTKLLNL